MKIFHEVFLEGTRKSKKDFKEVGIFLENGFSSFVVEESNLNWLRIAELIEIYQADDYTRTTFSLAEQKSVSHLMVITDWAYGYTKPDVGGGYLAKTYDLGDYCTKCGCGAKQRAPFILKKEPAWGRNDMFMLNWVFDEIFVKPEIWQKYFEPIGIDARPVHGYKNECLLDSVVHLVIPNSKTHLDIPGDAARNTCSLCARVKFLPLTNGFYPLLAEHNHLPLFKVQDYIGDGLQAYKPIIMDNSLFKVLKENKVKGIDATPLEEAR
ncbi:MAG: hypothetical protein OEZ58_23100 [Gammaproteobacteria bacterium]|nr:hypothetical protein [Gammaproteobacteria bacterium]